MNAIAADDRLPTPPLPRRGERWALFLDLDGTLCPFAPRPEDVAVGNELRQLVARLRDRLDGALCILSGRPVAQLRELLPELDEEALVGSHGAEGLPGLSADAREHPALDRLRRSIGAELAALDGAWLEAKPLGFAVHYRSRPELAAGVRLLVSRHLAAAPGLRALEGNCVVEVTLDSHSKGRAVAVLARQPRFAGRLPVAIGDDVTDEDAFRAARELDGFGVCVGGRRPTAASFGLPCVVMAHTWLQATADALGPRP